jgi:tRNA 2-selenouridine synthase
MVGLEPASQKTFESRMATCLRGHAGGPLILEGESRRVGDAVIPASVWKALDGGENLLLAASLKRRTEVLSSDYLRRTEALPQLREQLIKVEGRMQGTWGLGELMDQGRIDELVEVLLSQYYDPLYLHSEKGRTYVGKIDTEDPVCAAKEVVAWAEREKP